MENISTILKAKYQSGIFRPKSTKNDFKDGGYTIQPEKLQITRHIGQTARWKIKTGAVCKLADHKIDIPTIII
jgi:hypothetical protein